MPAANESRPPVQRTPDETASYKNAAPNTSGVAEEGVAEKGASAEARGTRRHTPRNSRRSGRPAAAVPDPDRHPLSFHRTPSNSGAPGIRLWITRWTVLIVQPINASLWCYGAAAES